MTQRTIKFRAWDKTNKIMLDVVTLDLRPDKQIVMQTFGKPQEQWHNFPDMVELMQFTGLTDKNGKEIWEGDIVKIKKRDYEIVYENYTAKFAVKSGDYSGEYMLQGDKAFKGGISFDMEVIGNIYENPELLNN